MWTGCRMVLSMRTRRRGATGAAQQRLRQVRRADTRRPAPSRIFNPRALGFTGGRRRSMGGDRVGPPPLPRRHDRAAFLVVQVCHRPGECPKGHGAGYTASAARQHHILPPPARKVALIVSRLAMTAFRTATALSSCPVSRLFTVPSGVAGSRRGTMRSPHGRVRIVVMVDTRRGRAQPATTATRQITLR